MTPTATDLQDKPTKAAAPDLLVISRLTDSARREGMKTRVPASIDWAFLDASDGHHPESLPAWSSRLLADTFWSKPSIKPGAFGCFLSHYRAWQECVRLGRPLMIAEDDIFFLRDFSLADIELACQGFEVTFLNRRAANWRNLVPDLAASSQPETIPMRQVVTAVSASLNDPGNANAPGMDFYRVTPTGAAQLIENADATGSVVGLDWFVVGCCLDGANLDGPWKTPRNTAKRITFAAPTNAGVVALPFAGASTAAVGGSVIGHSTSVPISEYRARIGQAG